MCCWSTRAASSKRRCGRLLGVGRLAGAQPGPQHRRPEGADRRLRARRATSCARGRASTARDVIDAYMAPRHGQCRGGGAAADRAPRRRRVRLRDGQWRPRPRRDHASTRAARSATVDFTGTSDQLPDNFNAPYSICRAATLYVFRTLVDDAIPMNDGCLRPIDLIVPEGSMLNPHYPGRGGRRQCRDQPGRHRRPVRRRPARWRRARGR